MRNINEIAYEIGADWKKVNPAAIPYLEIMYGCRSIDQYYGADSVKSIVSYFLCNAGSWKGETAKRIKAELKRMVK